MSTTKTTLENSRSEALLIGQNIPALGGKVTGVKKVQENVRRIELEGGKFVNVPVSRIKHIIEATLRTQHAKTGYASPIRTQQKAANTPLAQRNANFKAMFAAHATGKK